MKLAFHDDQVTSTPANSPPGVELKDNEPFDVRGSGSPFKEATNQNDQTCKMGANRSAVSWPAIDSADCHSSVHGFTEKGTFKLITAEEPTSSGGSGGSSGNVNLCLDLQASESPQSFLDGHCNANGMGCPTRFTCQIANCTILISHCDPLCPLSL